MQPYQGGGQMILHVNFKDSVYNDLPYKFEAGTQPIAEVIGLVPMQALTDVAEYYLGLEGFSINQVLETNLLE